MKTAKKILVVLAVTAAAAALAPPLAADSSVESDSSAALEQGSSRDIDPEKVLVGAASSRAAMGFPADQALVADILDTESGRASLERYSIPMTPTETEEFERRLGVLAKIPDLEAALAREHASSFAALYLDHATAGVAVLLVHGDQAERDRLEALAREHLDTSDLEVRPAARSLEQLRADFKALQGRLVEADAPRHGIVAWELDEMTNDIVVVTPSASDVATASELLSSVDAPDYVRVEVREASQQSEVWGGDDLSTCSAGAQVYADTVFDRRGF